ncbi:hypothetical protein PVAG01_01870 [Phlyctema vagabunda]|uniref:Mesaconyl-C4 CoA hydratase n=1 Tax=Phlyctema vagabunda TaxID=108571 RepID=A0ABR4PZD8_9HELO
MVKISMRLYSEVAPSAARVASEFLQASGSKTFIQEQLLDANQLQKLSLTLNRPRLYSKQDIASTPLAHGTPIPPGYHLAYFTPAGCEQDLGRDGSDKTANPPHTFTRRMWAGGSLHWDRKNLLRVGQTVRETTNIVAAVPKISKTGQEMIVVEVRKAFENEQGLALVDNRSWVFRPELSANQIIPEKPETVELPKGLFIRDFCQSPVSLFRFSALTFNGHKIHYSKEWCRDVEGHRDLVVHGPLNLINMLDLWRDHHKIDDTQPPESISYRATAPLYAGEPYRIVMEKGEESNASRLVVYSHARIDAMRGKILDFK